MTERIPVTSSDKDDDDDDDEKQPAVAAVVPRAAVPLPQVAAGPALTREQVRARLLQFLEEERKVCGFLTSWVIR
jgi:hypothetical protein